MEAKQNFVFEFRRFIQFKVVENSFPFFPDIVRILFDESYYLNENPDVANALTTGIINSASKHFFSVGYLESRSPSEYFDEDLYLVANPDVQAAVNRGQFISGLQHFTLIGSAEGRDALALTTEVNGIRLSALFDEAFYLHLYQDVAAAVARGDFSYGFEHFVRFGRFEKRDPSHYYDEDFYLANNSDVKNAVDMGAFTNGLAHYLEHGHLENRTASLLFNPQLYLNDNPDIAQAFKNGSLKSLFKHFLDFGQYEGRLATQLFDEAFYLQKNSDIQNAVSRGLFPSGYAHFLQYGIYERREVSPLFNEGDYLDANPDVKTAIKNGTFRSGIEHYLKFGLMEKRPLTVSEEPPRNSRDVANYSTAQAGVILNLETGVALSPIFGALASPRLMPLGDSITAGQHRSGPVPGGYRIQFWERAVADGLTIDFVGSQENRSGNLGDDDHEGHPGWTIGQIRTDIVQAGGLQQYPADAILLMIGTNDVNQGTGGSTILGRLESLINAILSAAPNTYLFVSSIPPVDSPRGSESKKAALNIYNGLIPALADNYSNVYFVNAGGSLTVADINGDNSATDDLDDGLHPTAEGYDKLGDAWYEAVFNPEDITGKRDLVGSNFNDRLIGDSGDNILTGGLGQDELIGNGGADTFAYDRPNAGVDKIIDFSANDTFQVSAAGFGGNLSVGSLEASRLIVGSSPVANVVGLATFLFDTTNSTLSFDVDGSGSAVAQGLAQFTNGFTLLAEQIKVVA